MKEFFIKRWKEILAIIGFLLMAKKLLDMFGGGKSETTVSVEVEKKQKITTKSETSTTVTLEKKDETEIKKKVKETPFDEKVSRL